MGTTKGITDLLGDLDPNNAEVRRALCERLYPIIEEAVERACQREGYSVEPGSIVNQIAERFLDGKLPQLAGQDGPGSAGVVNTRETKRFIGAVVRNTLASRGRRRTTRLKGKSGLMLSAPWASETQPSIVDVLALEAGLDSLRRNHERQAKALELRYWENQSKQSIADELQVGKRTVDADLKLAITYLQQKLARDDAGRNEGR